VAERSGDTAFGRTEIFLFYEPIRAHESGVALRFPPQSMTRFCEMRLDNNFRAAQSRINESNCRSDSPKSDGGGWRGSRRESAVAQLFSLGGLERAMSFECRNHL
jgi:hypothetical protein